MLFLLGFLSLSLAFSPVAPTGERKGAGTEHWPYRLFLTETISNGGCPGYVSGSNQEPFKRDLALKQLKALASEHGITMVVSLVQRDQIASLAKQVPLAQEAWKMHTEDRNYQRNVKLFEHVAELSKTHRVYVHCRHGTHRAVIVTMGAFIAAGKAKSVGEAFRLADGHLGSFQAGYSRPYLRHLVRYAREKGIVVEAMYKDF